MDKEQSEQETVSEEILREETAAGQPCETAQDEVICNPSETAVEHIDEEGTKDPSPKEGDPHMVLLWIMEVCIPLVLLLLLNIFVIRLVVVRGDSMYPTLYNNDFLIVRHIAYTPRQGDIVVCKTAADGAFEGQQLTKRVVATAGQTVFIDYANNTVTVDGIVLNEPYINLEESDPMENGGRENTIYLVPDDCVFVLGDNRNYSADSRSKSVGMVLCSDIVGGLLLRIPVGEWR